MVVVEAENNRSCGANRDVDFHGVLLEIDMLE
jgi:hypothetical protein